MKKITIGIIFAGSLLGEDEKILKRLSVRKNFDLILFDIYHDLDKKELEEKIKKCDIIYNNSAENFAIEFEKTLEELGKKVVDPSKSYYYSEDKWMFFLKCKEHNIPTPETILLSENLEVVKDELKKFGHWPVILKRIEGTCGEFVKKSNNIKDAILNIKALWKKGNEKQPIIAQEFIDSPSYRVTVIDKKIVQTAVKNSKGWKKTGVYAKRIKRFKIDKELKVMVKKINEFSGIKICGIDFLKKQGKWLALEINSAPAFDFFEYEREKIIKEVIEFLKKEARKKSKNYS